MAHSERAPANKGQGSLEIESHVSECLQYLDVEDDGIHQRGLDR